MLIPKRTNLYALELEVTPRTCVSDQLPSKASTQSWKPPGRRPRCGVGWCFDTLEESFVGTIRKFCIAQQTNDNNNTTMNSLKLACLALVATSTTAFTMTNNGPAAMRRSLATVLQERPDSSAAVAAALEASKKFGATSPEARLAWEAVEDMDAADNRYVVRNDECMPACMPVDMDDGSACLPSVVRPEPPGFDEYE